MTERIGPGPLLDAWRNPKQDVRVAVEAWWVYGPVAQQYIERSRRLGIIWNYWKRVGAVAVWRKVRSRLSERRRNKKMAGIGVGRVLEAPANSHIEKGQSVVFFAPNHSLGWPRVTLDARLVHPLNPDRANGSWRAGRYTMPDRLRRFAGWSPYSGVPIDASAVKQELTEFAANQTPTRLAQSRRASSMAPQDRERRPADSIPADRPTAVLFGLGNYAKTQILPSVRRHLCLSAIHEIDPDQIESVTESGVTLDTSPLPREGERYNVWFIAGFHHSHGPLAVQALEQGAWAVVEKPLVTTREQFGAIERAIGTNRDPRLFTCFHKRYSRLNEWARIDLGVGANEPVDMHCMVYEIPLPALHWYNWPNSGSRLISNGCHWLDYFLYMNGFSAVARHRVHALRGDDLIASVELDNGAQLTMSLTSTGSERLGVRDLIELRARDVTIRLIDSTYYESETTSRVLRRRRVNPMHAYGQMYDTICRRIVAGEKADSLESLRSTVLMLDLEDELRADRRAEPPGASTPTAAAGSLLTSPR